MSLPARDRAIVEAAYLCGPKSADFIELAGIDSLDALADADPHVLRLEVNARLGRPHINAMGVRAFASAIEAAKHALERRGSADREDGPRSS